MNNAAATLSPPILNLVAAAAAQPTELAPTPAQSIEFKSFLAKQAVQSKDATEPNLRPVAPALSALPAPYLFESLPVPPITGPPAQLFTPHSALAGGTALPSSGQFLPAESGGKGNKNSLVGELFNTATKTDSQHVLTDAQIPLRSLNAHNPQSTPQPDSAAVVLVPGQNQYAVKQTPTEVPAFLEQSQTPGKPTVDIQAEAPQQYPGPLYAKGDQISDLLTSKRPTFEAGSIAAQQPLKHNGSEATKPYTAQLTELVSGWSGSAQVTGASQLLPGNGLISAQANNVTQAAFGEMSLNQEGVEEPLAKQVMLLAYKGQQSARLQLNPPELGAVDIKLELRDSDVKLNLLTHTPVARDLLEAALPRLREIMHESGMNLLEAEVTQRGSSQLSHSRDTGGEARDSADQNCFDENGEFAETSELASSTRPERPETLIDVFA